MKGQPMKEHLKHPKVRLEIEMGRLDDLIADLVLVKILEASRVLGIAINQNATCKPNIEYNVKYQDDGTDKFYLSLLGSISSRDARHRCGTGLFFRSLPIPQVLCSQEDLFCLSLHSRPLFREKNRFYNNVNPKKLKSIEGLVTAIASMHNIIKAGEELILI